MNYQEENGSEVERISRALSSKQPEELLSRF